jgi:hypothetical protein
MRLSPGEVTLSYGDGLGNDRLMSQYGFTLPSNPHGAISWPALEAPLKGGGEGTPEKGSLGLWETEGGALAGLLAEGAAAAVAEGVLEPQLAACVVAGLRARAEALAAAESVGWAAGAAGEVAGADAGCPRGRLGRCLRALLFEVSSLLRALPDRGEDSRLLVALAQAPAAALVAAAELGAVAPDPAVAASPRLVNRHHCAAALRCRSSHREALLCAEVLLGRALAPSALLE